MTSTRTEQVAAPDGSGGFDVTIVTPDGGSGPGILLLQEIFGVGEFVLAKADALDEDPASSDTQASYTH